jgi:hypothetical protein
VIILETQTVIWASSKYNCVTVNRKARDFFAELILGSCPGVTSKVICSLAHLIYSR